MTSNREETKSIHELVFSELDHEQSIDKNIDKPEAIERKLNYLLPWSGYKERMKEYYTSKLMEITKTTVVEETDEEKPKPNPKTNVDKVVHSSWIEKYTKDKYLDYYAWHCLC